MPPADPVLWLLPPGERYPPCAVPSRCRPVRPSRPPVPSLRMLRLPPVSTPRSWATASRAARRGVRAARRRPGLGGRWRRCYPTRNVAASAKLYTVDPGEHLRADRDAEARGIEIIGVFHSHTHTDAYPSPTDVAQAPDPDWHYVLVSLRDTHPMLRSYRIDGGRVDEEPVIVEPR